MGCHAKMVAGEEGRHACFANHSASIKIILTKL